MKTRMHDCTERYEPEVGEKFILGGYALVAKEAPFGIPSRSTSICDGCVLGMMHEGDRLKGLLCLEVICAPACREDRRNIIVVDDAP